MKMKSKSKRIISLIVMLTLSASLLAGCKNTDTVSSEVRVLEKQNVKPEIPTSEYDFIVSGASEYFILLPENATNNEEFAASELQKFVKEASGAELSIVKENKADFTGSFLSVGNTKASQEAGVMPTYEEFQRGGFQLKTVEDDCYIKGYTDIGTRNGIYEFLYYCFDYECYATDEIVMTETDDLRMPSFDLDITPSFDFRKANGGDVVGDDVLAYRMRFNTTDELFVTGNSCHTSFQFVDPWLYNYQSETYKDWFSPKRVNLDESTVVPAQLCYSNTEMWEVYLKNVKEQLKISALPFCMLGMEDNEGWCDCEKCAESKEKYGADSATIIKFCNYMQTEINKWYEEEYPEREPVTLVIFAYHSSEKAPCSYDEKTGEYVPVDESVVLHEDSAVMYAPIRANVAYDFNSKENEDVKTNIEQWNAISDMMMFWTYTLNPGHLLTMVDTFEVIQENYQLMAENDGVYLLDQLANDNVEGNSAWERCTTYVMSKLQWNVDLNMEELIADFFANYFDVASETMRGIFDAEREWIRHAYADLGRPQTLFGEHIDADYWYYPVLLDWMAQIEQAYEDIEVYKELNSERYQQLYDRITLESLQFRYLIIRLHATNYSESELMDMKYAFRRDMERLEVKTYRDMHNIDELWEEWGIAD